MSKAKSNGKSSVYKSAITGQFVPKAYAEKHPKTTVKQTVKKP